MLGWTLNLDCAGSDAGAVAAAATASTLLFLGVGLLRLMAVV